MTHQYKISGMTCDHCVQTVKKALQSMEAVKSAEVTLSPPQAVVTMHHHLTEEAMNEVLARHGHYHLKEMAFEGKHHPDQHEGHKKQSDEGNGGGHHHEEHDHHNGHDHHDHGSHHRMMIEDFKKRFWVSLLITIPVLILSPMIQDFLGFEWSFPNSRYVLFVLSSLIYFYGGWPFLKGMKEELGDHSPGMMTLIAVAVSAAFMYSSAVVFGLQGKTFFWETATLIVVMLLGHWLEMRSVLGASKALEALAALMPNEANLVKGDSTQKIAISDLKKGDIVLIKPGEKVPADGEITDGETDLNESMLTGESKPVSKGKGDEVIAGSVNGNGPIKVAVKGTGSDSYLSKVIQMVQDAQGQKSKTQRLADRAAFWLTIIALAGGIGTFATWLLMGREFSFALERMVTVMVICCPHALGLAIPLVAAISTSMSAKNGLLIRNRTAFENARKITTIVFDKTGTLTRGSHEVVKMIGLSEKFDKKEMLRFAAGVEAPSEHHIAKGLQRKASAEKIKVPPVSDFKYQSGIGVSGIIEDRKVQAGGHLLLEQLGISPPGDAEEGEDTKIFIVIDSELIGFITFADEIRESSFDAIKTLRDNGIKVSLLTGDNEKVAAAVAQKLGMDDYLSEVLPDDKLSKIKDLQNRGEFVAMTGDGVNDAPALAQANIGIAIGSGTDVAAETADIVLVNSDPKDITNLILFGKATYRKMVQNLVWATGYNVVALPLATGFVPGLIISPAFGAALMSVSTIICAVNAQLLRFKLK